MINYTTTLVGKRDDVLICATPDMSVPDRARLLEFANYFGARISRRPPGYIMTPGRAEKFERLFGAGFCADGKVLRHPAVPSRTFGCQEGLNIIQLADYLVDQCKHTLHISAHENCP